MVQANSLDLAVEIKLDKYKVDFLKKYFIITAGAYEGLDGAGA
jgi:hypothetical protein